MNFALNWQTGDWILTTVVGLVVAYLRVSRYRRSLQERRKGLLEDLSQAAWSYAEAQGVQDPTLPSEAKERAYLGEVARHLQTLQEQPVNALELAGLRVHAWRRSMIHKRLPTPIPRPVPPPLPRPK